MSGSAEKAGSVNLPPEAQVAELLAKFCKGTQVLAAGITSQKNGDSKTAAHQVARAFSLLSAAHNETLELLG